MRRTLAFLGFVILFCSTLRGGDWTEFRGPLGNGHVPDPDGKAATLPLGWSETENVTWKTPIPHHGWSTPVVMQGQVWLTTATDDGHDFFVYCLDSKTGKIKFEKKLFHSDAPEPLSNGVNCYGSPSPVIEAGRVYISFGSYGTACLDTATYKTLWQRTDLPCRHYRGPGSSLVMFENLVIVTMDGVDVQYLAALDKQTGETVWKTARSTAFNDLDSAGQPKTEGDLRKGFSTPILIDVQGKPILVSAGSKAFFGYDPRTGHEVWQIFHGSHTSAPRPVYAQGIVFSVTGMGATELWAVKPDGKGDVSNTHVVWRNTSKQVARTASPIVVDDLLYMASDTGVLTCLETATGKEVWKERVGGRFASSPIYAAGRLYFFAQDGKTTVIKPGRAYEWLSLNTLSDGFMSSPAVAEGALFLRTKAAVYRIESR